MDGEKSSFGSKVRGALLVIHEIPSAAVLQSAQAQTRIILHKFGFCKANMVLCENAGFFLGNEAKTKEERRLVQKIGMP